MKSVTESNPELSTIVCNRRYSERGDFDRDLRLGFHIAMRFHLAGMESLFAMSRVALANASRRYPNGGGVGPLDLVIEAGEFAALLGPTGSGETTLLELTAGLEPCDSGSVTVDAGRVLGPARQCQLVFAEHPFPWLSARENGAFGLRAQGCTAREIEKRVEHRLDAFALTKLGLLAIPSVAYVPFAVVWFGSAALATRCAVVLVAMVPMAPAAISSVQAVSPRLIQSARILGLIMRVLLPAALPRLVDGLRQAWVYSWRGLLSGELFVRGGIGLGIAMEQARKRGDIATMIAVSLIVIVVSQGVDALLFRSLERHFRHFTS